MFRLWFLGLPLCLLSMYLGASSTLPAAEMFLPLRDPADVFTESNASSSLDGPLASCEFPEGALLERLPPPEDEFAVGIASTGRLSHPRALRDGPSNSDRSPFKSGLFWMPAQAVQNQPGELAISGQELDFGLPLRIDDQGIWLAVAGIQRLNLRSSIMLPDSGLPVPDQLWDLEGGLLHRCTLADGRQVGGMLRIGSPSDRPFAAWRDLTVTFLGFLTIPAREEDQWSFSVFYSPTGQIIFPIPGVAYVWRPNDRLKASLGIPFSLEYHPTETSFFTASYMPLNNVDVLLRQSLGEAWSVYGGYRTRSQTFLLADREVTRERTYVFDQRVTVGVQRELWRNWSVDLSTAYVFDRRFFQAEKFSGSRRDELVIDPGIAATLQLMWTR